MDHDIPSELAIDLDQTHLSYIFLGKSTFSSNGSKDVPIKGIDDKTATFVATATGSHLPIKRIDLGKSKRYLPKFTYCLPCHVHNLSLIELRKLQRSFQFHHLSLFVRQKEGPWLPARAAFSDYHGHI